MLRYYICKLRYYTRSEYMFYALCILKFVCITFVPSRSAQCIECHIFLVYYHGLFAYQSQMFFEVSLRIPQMFNHKGGFDFAFQPLNRHAYYRYTTIDPVGLWLDLLIALYLNK